MYKKTISLLLLFLFCQIFTNIGLAQNDNLNINAKAYLLIDAQSGRILTEKNSDEKRAMASTTKIMTAIIALENGDLHSKVKVSTKAASVGGSSFWLKAGDELTLESMIYGLLLPSGNDAAIAIAEHIAGSVENFVAMMNHKAVDIGANNTHFKNPHGLDEPGHFSTANDLAKIAKYALNIPKFREIVKTKEKLIIDQNKTKHIFNTNRLLSSFEGANGIKTGYTSKAGRCLVASARRNGLELISVVLGTQDSFNTSYGILSYGFSHYKARSVARKGQFQASVSVNNGIKDKVRLISEKDLYIAAKNDEDIEVKRILPQSIDAPVYKGDKIGELHIYINKELLFKVPLVAESNIRQKKLKDIIYRILKEWVSINNTALETALFYKICFR